MVDSQAPKKITSAICHMSLPLVTMHLWSRSKPALVNHGSALLVFVPCTLDSVVLRAIDDGRCWNGYTGPFLLWWCYRAPFFPIF